MTRLERAKGELRALAPAFAEKVAPIYTLLNWKWTVGNNEMRVPGASEILRSLLMLIGRLDESGRSSCRTGGLIAWYEPSGNECGIEFHMFEIAETYDESSDEAALVEGQGRET